MSVVMALLLVVMLYRYAKLKSIHSDYVFFCLVFMLLFYLLPLVLMELRGSFVYVNNTYVVGTEDILFLSGCFVVFIMGFFVADGFIATRLRRSNKATESISLAFSKKYIIVLLMSLFLILAYFQLTNYSQVAYLIRQGYMEGNYFITLLLILCSVSAIFCLAASVEIKKDWLIFASIVVVLLFAFQLGGRTTVLFSIAYVAIVFGVNLKKAVGLTLILFPVVLPFLGSGKTLIYVVTTGGEFSDYNFDFSFSYSGFIDRYFEIIIGNFSHPVVSMLVSPELVQRYGFSLFYDYIQGFLFYLKIIGVDFGDSLIYYNTELILGLRQSIIPTGYLAFGYVQAGIIGIFVSGVFYRWLGYFAFIFLSIDRSSNIVLRFYITLITSFSFYTGETRVMVLGVFIPWMVTKLYLIIFSRGARARRS